MELSNQAGAVGKRWDFCASGYDGIVQEELQSQAAVWQSILLAQAPQKQGSLLDIGTGPGFFSILMAQAGWDVTGVDCSAAMVETAAENAKKAGVRARFLQQDIHVLDFPDHSFDYLVSRNVTWILYDPEKAFAEWRRVLKPGGRLLYFDANWYYRRSEAERQAIARDEEEYRKTYGPPVDTYSGDAATEASFQETLFFHSHSRPEWDRTHLGPLGFTHIRITPRLNEQVYTPPYKLLFRSIPLFMVQADV